MLAVGFSGEVGGGHVVRRPTSTIVQKVEEEYNLDRWGFIGQIFLESV